MGSSCFTRGNSRILAILQKHIAAQGLDDRCFLQGQLCEEKCQGGPRMSINDTVYEHIDPDTVLDILHHHLEQGREP
jgi:NADH:ubiquinone oxidoreductase subunit E